MAVILISILLSDFANKNVNYRSLFTIAIVLLAVFYPEMFFAGNIEQLILYVIKKTLTC